MVAEPLLIHRVPALLFEPDPLTTDPSTGRWADRQQGWRIRNGAPVRWHDDDAWGAVVQEIIVRYTLHGVPRRQLANEYPISERQIQTYVTGERGRDRGWHAYAAPVRRALARLGFRPGRRTMARQRAATAAICRLAGDLLLLLDHDTRPGVREIRASLRLLAEMDNDGR